MKTNFKNVGALEKLLDICDKHGASYRPGNPSIESSALKTLFAEAQKSIQAEQTLQAVLENAIRLRAKTYKNLPLFVTRFVNSAKAGGMPKDQLVYLNRIARRFRSQPFKGVDTTEKNPAPPETTVSPQTTSRFNRQLSYEVMAGSFSDIIKRVEGQPMYNPNEPEFTIEGLKSKLAQLQDYNANVIKAKNAVSQARKKSNDVIFNYETGIPAIVGMVKAYIRSIFGTNSVEFKNVRSIRIRVF